MELKQVESQLSDNQKIYYELLSKYEQSLIKLGLSEEEVQTEIAEYIQFGNLF